MNDETTSIRPIPQSENKSTPGPVSAGSSEANDKKDSGSQDHPSHHRLRMKTRTKRILIWGGAALVAVVLAIAIVPRLIRSHNLAKDKKNQQSALPSVTVAIAKAVPPTIDLEVSGTMSALTEAPVLARADGYLVKRFVDIGDHVRKGQLLAVIDSPDLDQQVRQARASLNESESALEQAEHSLNQAEANQGLAAVTAQRWARLQEKGAVSRQDNDTNQANYKAQTANVDASAANVKSAAHNVASNEANLARLRDLQGFERLVAPFDGIITARNLDIGALITQGTTLVFRVAQIDVLRTYISVPQTNAPSVHAGDPAWISFAEFPGRSFPAAITRTANALDPTTRTMLTEVQLPNAEHRFYPGMYAAVKLVVPTTLGSAVIIPGESLIVRSEGPLVAVVTDQNAIHLQPINVGHDYGNMVEVVGGLKAEQQVVVNPGDSVIEGAKVNPVRQKQGAGENKSTGTGSPRQSAPSSEGKSHSAPENQSGDQQPGQSNSSNGNSEKQTSSGKKQE